MNWWNKEIENFKKNSALSKIHFRFIHLLGIWWSFCWVMWIIFRICQETKMKEFLTFSGVIFIFHFNNYLKYNQCVCNLWLYFQIQPIGYSQLNFIQYISKFSNVQFLKSAATSFYLFFLNFFNILITIPFLLIPSQDSLLIMYNESILQKLLIFHENIICEL